MSSSILIVGKQQEEIELLRKAAEQDSYKLQVVNSSQQIPSREDFDPDLIVLTSDFSNEDAAGLLPDENTRSRYIRVVNEECWSTTGSMPFLGALSKNSSLGETRYRLKQAIEQRCLMRNLRLSSTKISSDKHWREMFSSSDLVTGLDNRVRFLSELKKNISRSARYKRPFCCLLGRINNYKELLASLEQEKMEDTIEELAGIFEVSIRDADTLARVEDDLFGLVLTETDFEQASVVVNRIRNMIANYPYRHKLPIAVDASFGLSPFEEKSEVAPEEMLAEAEKKLEQ